MYPASTELIAVAWLKTISGIAVSGMVSTQLPSDATSWSATGFIKVGPVVGGTPNSYVPLREPVIQVDTYGVNLNSKHPNWATANMLAELVTEACYANTGIGIELTTRTGYRNGVVVSTYPVSEVRRVYDDPVSYGHYQVDIALHWKQIDGTFPATNLYPATDLYPGV